MWCLSAYPLQSIQDVFHFVSSVEHKPRFLTQTVAVCQSYNLSQWAQSFESKKNIHRQNQIKPCGSWRYIDVLYTKRPFCARNWTVFLYIFFTSDTGNVQLSWAHRNNEESLMRNLCIYLYVPEHVTCHMPDVVDELRRVGHCLYQR